MLLNKKKIGIYVRKRSLKEYSLLRNLYFKDGFFCILSHIVIG